jgi:hypothetical protein
MDILRRMGVIFNLFRGDQVSCYQTATLGDQTHSKVGGSADWIEFPRHLGMCLQAGAS